MKIENNYLTLKFDDNDGSLISLTNSTGQEFIGQSSRLPLVTLQIRKPDGSKIQINSAMARKIDIQNEHCKNIERVNLAFSDFADFNIAVFISITLPYDSGLTNWSVKLKNDTVNTIEWIDVPGIRIPNDLSGTGKGHGKLVWPGNEGALITDVSARDKGNFPYWDADYPSRGIPGGIYPGPVPTQFMAYYRGDSGLYIGAHDPDGNVKSFEYELLKEGNIRLQFRQYTNALQFGELLLGYPLVIGVFSGDWHDAADIYRDWFHSAAADRIKKIEKNRNLPEWYKESPVVITYPVRGRHDMDEMKPNHMYPYTNGFPVVKHYNDSLKSHILVLLMHWEGTAPWAPPFVWPPFGEMNNFNTFRDELHKSHNYLGLYCSGMGYTKHSNLIPQYDNSEKIQDENLLRFMNAGPDGNVSLSAICTGQRSGYDMCVSTDFAKKTILSEMEKIIDHDIDYIQAMDQNHGGAAYFCYSKNHMHPAGPGKWQTIDMQNLYEQMNDIVHQTGKKVLFGCESVSAEPFISELMFNDARYELNFQYGQPIPLYAYIYHEYINNFMGNQCCTNAVFDNEYAPDNVLYRLAYSFSAGDMLTLVLNEFGEIYWSWGENPDLSLPEQSSIIRFVRNANAWRQGKAKKYLLYGSMEKPFPVKNIPTHIYHFKNGENYIADNVLVSRWKSSDGDTGEFFANYTADDISLQLNIPDMYSGICIFDNAEKYEPGNGERYHLEANTVNVVIPPYSVTLTEFLK